MLTDNNKKSKNNSTKLMNGKGSNGKIAELSNEENGVLPLTEPIAEIAPKMRKRRSGLSLRLKATLLAIAIGTLPIVATGTIAYLTSSRALRAEVSDTQEEQAIQINDKINRFMFERYGDIQVLAGLNVLRDLKVSGSTTTPQQRKEALEYFVTSYKVYDSIAVFGTDGNLIVQAGSTAALPNIKERVYFQAALTTGKPYISQPEISKVTKEVSIFFSAPIKDAVTGQTIAIVRSRMPIKALDNVIVNYGSEEKGDTYHIFGSDGVLFMAAEKEQVGRNALEDIPGLRELHAKGETKQFVTHDISNGGNVEQIGAYSKLPQFQDMPNLNWGNAYLAETDKVLVSEIALRNALLIGTGAAALLVGLLAAFLVNRATRPIIRASEAVEKLGQGELDTRIEGITGDDELAVLGTNINVMASQIQTLIDEQTATAERKNLVATIASQLRQSLDLNTILETLVHEAKTALKAERVVIYRFNPDWSGYLSHEAVSPGLPSALAEKATDPCIPQTLLDAYRNGRIVPTNDMQERDYHPDHRALLSRLAIKANLVVPIVQQNQLFGLLVAHHCTQTHVWLDNEIDFMSQLATQAGSAIGQATFVEQIEVARVEARQEADQTAQQQRQEKETLQKRALELLMEVDPVSKGDLTVRAKVTADEIGTLADSYNSIIRSLRQIVEQVQTASQSVVTTTQGNEMAVASAATESGRQAKSITNALSQIQIISESILGVASRAKQAEEQVAKSNLVVQAGDEAMNRTVTGISAIRETVSETSKKVKRLGEASQKISKVVNLIGNFAAQTNLLALNAAIEAARAGEEGRGFAVVAEEVRALAQQSAAATADIEQLVEEIQAQTNEVVAAMEAGTEQVVVGTQLVEESRQKLSQISAVSAQVNKLVQEISLAAVAQTQTSASVSQTMQDVATSAQDASEQSATVASSFKQLLEVAKALQVSVGQFKLS
ncbi:methyl-accepting chemotaxis protein [Tumidithrix elongata RA019]|uniref:Methyl-accepting chemotaxis protein n=1 Tax=Tumidithrix elongata BACA0141 TaxID=2716417 RepID=A0AAW9PWZ0_9CYAN|nr:methyl-accepting chemotaxis protein [Tumidithrix elongata RA019]